MIESGVKFEVEIDLVIRDKYGNIKSRDSTKMTPEEAIKLGLLTTEDIK